GVSTIKNFDIKNEAGGVDKAVIKIFNNILVTNRTLEIRLQYAGKGTTAVPMRGLYGPLISAISIESEFMPLELKQVTHGKKRTFLVIGVVAAVFLFILIVVGIAWKKGYIGNQISRERGV
ncbi:hypothetical protein M8C21_016714, partial [Ambrosia artemisiifolia]